jgi:hypothetical protein
MGLRYETIQIPLAKGVNLKPHEFALDVPDLRVAENVIPDRWGSAGAMSHWRSPPWTPTSSSLRTTAKGRLGPPT